MIESEKYATFQTLLTLNRRLNGSFIVQAEFIKADGTQVIKLALYEDTSFIGVYSKLSQLLDTIEIEMGKRWMDEHSLYA